MKRILLAAAVATTALILAVPRAEATYHIMVIDQLFFGFQEAPDAQYVQLRMQLGAQNQVHGQTFPIFDADGTPQAPFGTFCTNPQSTARCNLPRVSPACPTVSQCPSALEANDERVLIATQRAQDLFCVTGDLVATGTLPYPAGRICFGDVGSFAAGCTAAGPVDCVAYGNYVGPMGIFGSAAAPPMRGAALVGVPARQSQCHTGVFDTLNAAAVCVGGINANTACTTPGDCPDGLCVSCPGAKCSNLLDNSVGFMPGDPSPRNYHGDLGEAGLAGDPEGSGLLSAEGIEKAARILFQFDRRCASGLPPKQRGADANLDTRISAADIIATIKIVSAAASQGGGL